MTRQLIFGCTALALAAIFCTSVASYDAVQLRNVDGGQDYYSQFSNSLPSDPNYFPLGVWSESVISQGDVDRDSDIGLNLYMGLTANSDLSLVQRKGMRAILQQSEWRNNQTAIKSPAVVGWALLDEIDMQEGPGRGYATLSKVLAQLPHDGRLRYNNYGKGVMFWETDDQAERFVNDFQQVVSSDLYWFTDPNIAGSSEGGKLLDDGRPLTPIETRRAANYGYTIDRMRGLDKTHKPIWSFVEVGWPSSETAAQGGRSIEPTEVVAGVWHSIIAGARGIIYFNHSFGGPHQSFHCLREPGYAAVRAAVKNTNQLIGQLAPVLNAPFADGFVSVDPSVRTMAKFYHNGYYVFVGSKENRTSAPTFLLSGVDHGRATVIGEDRMIPIANSRFSDQFKDGNAIHIYKIDNQ
jgi:hypothetical protein